MVVVYPNQKIVTVHKAPANKENVYGVLNKAAAFSALQNLTHNELKVFMYLASQIASASWTSAGRNAVIIATVLVGASDSTKIGAAAAGQAA